MATSDTIGGNFNDDPLFIKEIARLSDGKKAYRRIVNSYNILAYSDVVYQLRRHSNAPWRDDVIRRLVRDIAYSSGEVKKRSIQNIGNFLETEDLKVVLQNSTPYTDDFAMNLLHELGQRDSQNAKAIPYLVEACAKDPKAVSHDLEILCRFALTYYCSHNIGHGADVLFDRICLDYLQGTYSMQARHNADNVTAALVDYGLVYEWDKVMEVAETTKVISRESMVTVFNVAAAHRAILETVSLPDEFKNCETLADYAAIEFKGQNGLMWLARANKIGVAMEQSALRGKKMTAEQMVQSFRFAKDELAPASLAHVMGLRGSLYGLMHRPHLFERGQADVDEIYDALPRAMQRRYDMAKDVEHDRRRVLNKVRRPKLG